MTVYAKVRPAIDFAAAEMWAGRSKPSSTSCVARRLDGAATEADGRDLPRRRREVAPHR